MAERIDLQQEPDLEALDFAQFDEAIEDRLPVRLRAKLSSVTKKRVTP